MGIHKCEICNFSSKQKNDLNRHLKTKKHLNNVKQYEADNKKFLSNHHKIPQNTTKIPQKTTFFKNILKNTNVSIV